MRTLSTTPVDPTNPEGINDLDNTVVDGIFSLRQRLEQRLKFSVGEWQLDDRLGTESVLGREYTPQLAIAVISGAIRDEGAEEVTGVGNVTTNLERSTRQLRYIVHVDSIYGPMTITGVAV